MSTRQGTYVCTTGRSGTVYLERVFSHHAMDHVRVLHEKHESSDITKRPEGQHLIITGRKMLSELYDDVHALKGPNFIILVRDLEPTCLSWVRFLLPDYVENKVPHWWFGREPIPFDSAWSAFQRFTWHWFVTWCRTRTMLCGTEDTRVFCLPFKELSDPVSMNALFRRVGDMRPCSEESLTQCRVEGTAHGTKQDMIDRVGDIDVEHEVSQWYNSLNLDAKTLVKSTLDWLSSMGFVEDPIVQVINRCS
jgi:hypothetical protein